MNRIVEFFWPGIPNDDTGLGREIRLQQFLLVARAVTTISSVNLLNTFLTGFLFWNVLPHTLIAPWIAVSILASGSRVWASWRARSRNMPTKVSRRTIVRSTLWSALGGVLWGVLGIGMIFQDSILHHVFLAFVIGGQAAAAAVWLAPILSSSYAYIWFSVLPLVIGLASKGHPMTSVMAGMVCIFLIASFQLARRTHADFVNAVTDRLKVEHLYEQLGDSEDRLITAIETIDAGFALFDPDDKLVLANSRYREFYDLSSSSMHKGAYFEDILRTGARAGQHPEAIGRIEEWISERMSRHLNPRGPQERLLSNNRWLQESEYRTNDGGLVSVSTDITRLKQAYDSLKVALDQAETANKAKSEFLSSMSHELRTPLNAILGFAQLMQSDPKAEYSPEQEESIRQILSGGNHLLELISQILDLARIETGNIVVSIENVVLQDVLSQSMPLAEALARKHNIILNVTPVENEVVVRGDATRIKQVLLNLLSNAIKYNNPGGEVSVDCSVTDKGSLIVAVSDNGPGIPEEKQDQVFEPFNRLGEEAGEKEGSGIGLTITRQLLELMKGKIGFESKFGEGTTFWFEIPVASIQDKEVPETLVDEAGEPISANGATGCVLYIEDNPANVRLMEGIFLHRPSAELLIANSAEEGLEIALSSKPDLVFMDIGLPGMDGYEAAGILKSDPATSKIPVVMVSAFSDPDELDREKEAVFDKYLSKPLAPQDVLDEVDARIGSKEQFHTV